jgi:hypothetical protein
LTTPRLVVATPIRAAEMHAASVSLGYAEMLIKLHRLLPVEVLAGSLTFAADIVRGRNRIAATVLREHPDATHVLWLDDDQWCDDVAVVPEMMALGIDVVGAPYTNKRQPMRWVHRNTATGPLPVHEAAAPLVVRPDLLEVDGVGFGFTLTSTRALREISATERVYTDHPNPHRVANIFGQVFHHPAQRMGVDVAEEDQALLSEDYSFCLRWRGLGERVYLYTRAGIIHHAGPHDWNAREMPGGVVG